MDLVIGPDGTIQALYDEALDLSLVGPSTIARASHVECDRRGAWRADLSPVAGPVLGPFSHRSEALQAEQDWLNEHWLR